MYTYEGDTDPLIFPLTLNEDEFDLTDVSYVAMVWSGWGGKLAATLTSGATVTILDVQGGLVQWAQVSGNLLAKYSPYHIYFRCYSSGGTYITAPRGNNPFVIYVADNLL